MEIELQNQRRRALTATGLTVLAFVLWLGLLAPRGTMWDTDELLTAERSREMLLTGERGVVHYNFHRSFEKPPLQYWLTSFTLPRFENRAVAVRIWPLLYAVLTASALGWFILLIKPEEPWLIPLSMGILFSSPLFSIESARGLLDIGLAFFTILTVVFAEIARKKPVWWLGVAIACWLGSLQKMPVPFVVWVLILITRLTSSEERANLRRGLSWLVPSLLLSIGLMSIWPLLQVFKYDMPVWKEYQQEVVEWLGPTELGRRPYFEILISMSLHPGGFCGFLSLIAMIVVLFSKKERASRQVMEIALVTLGFLVLMIVSNFRLTRYVIPVVPLLCLLLALVFYRFLKRAAPGRTAAVMALVGLLIAGFVHSNIHLAKRRRDLRDEKAIAEKLGQLQRADTGIVLIKAVVPGNDLLWDSFYLFHGNLRFPTTKLTSEELRRNPPKPPLIGACVARDLPLLQQLYPNLEIQLTRAQFVCWQVAAK